jgi:hypothetical protein
VKMETVGLCRLLWSGLFVDPEGSEGSGERDPAVGKLEWEP